MSSTSFHTHSLLSHIISIPVPALHQSAHVAHSRPGQGGRIPLARALDPHSLTVPHSHPAAGPDCWGDFPLAAVAGRRGRVRTVVAGSGLGS